MKLKLTASGIQCLHRCLDGGPAITFVGISMGDGDNAGLSANSLTNTKVEIGISAIERNGEFVQISGILNNSTIEKRFLLTELGVFIKDQDDESEKVLFAYGHVEQDEATVIPAATDFSLETIERVTVYIGEIEDFSAVITESMVVATREELLEHTENKNNPHKTTPEQIGAAKKSHTHDLIDISGGQLPVKWGGTGGHTAEEALKNLGGCRVLRGAYSGSGKKGQYQPNKLSFNFSPQFVVVQNGRFSIMLVRDMPYVTVLNSFDDEFDWQGVYVNWDEKSVSWYHGGSYIYQMNDYTTYYYIAIG